MWQNKKSKALYKGGYDYNKAGKRTFELVAEKGKQRYVFSSREAAQKQGWKYIK